MNMKNVTKSGLNDFINAKVRGNIASVNQEIDILINNKLNPILDSFVDCKKVEKSAQTLADEMTKALEKYEKILTGWKYTEIVQNCNRYATVLGQKVRDEVFNTAQEYIKNPQKGVFDLGSNELNDAVKELQKEARVLYQRINDLGMLRRELERVIKNEPTGGRGYKALVALGVDMEGFEETSGNLPAIVKLSVDVCVLNGDCNKKETA